jgi:CDP-glucose 4,6-dehydratase
MLANAFHDKTVWLLERTGFKGARLARWLLELGGRVRGSSLPPPVTSALFRQLGLNRRRPNGSGVVWLGLRPLTLALDAMP